VLIGYWLFMVFVLGAVLGSFLNVCIARLPLEKSIFWPGSRCGSCYQRIPLLWRNIPLLSYWLLRGRCATCGAPFSIRYFLVELATALGFAGLFYLEVVMNIHRWPGPAWQIEHGIYPWQWWIAWGYHALLFCFLMVAAVCDLDGREIPLPLTMTGTLIGLAGAALLPWPWPLTPADALPRLVPGEVGPGWEWMDPKGGLKQGLYPWPVCGPLPAWLPPGSWQLGLATGLAGALAGSLLLRGMRFVSSKGLGREALGLGDADLMMMAGSFLGWQLVVAAFFLSVVPALVFAVVMLIVYRDNSLPFGPSLAAGVVLAWLVWPWLGPAVQVLAFWGTLLGAFVGFAAVFVFGAMFLMRVLRGLVTGSH
jgi:leader peptidase (prepilin peptidase)/N-methyltransferase